MKTHRIGFLIWNLSKGGAERVVANLASQHAANGHHTVIITYSHSDGEYRLDSRVKRYELDQSPGELLNPKTFIRRLFITRKICREEHLDVLVAFLDGGISYAILATMFLKTKTIISVRNAPEVLYRSKLNRAQARYLYPLADGAVFQTNDARDWFPKRLQRKSSVLMNPISDEFYDISYEPEACKIVNCARLIEAKDQVLLVDAFSLVLKYYPRATLHIYGVGKLQDKLERKIKDMGLNSSVFLEGRSNNVAEVLSTATIFVLSSKHEGCPNALMEAMAVGVPSISTDCPCGGPKMLIGNNDNGILIPVGDNKALADALVYLLSDPKAREDYSRKGKQVAYRFREEKVFEEWRNYIKTIINLPSGRKRQC